MFILQVIPITKSIRVPSLSYFSARDVSLGSFVTVPLRKQEVQAIVISKESVVNIKSLVRSAEYQLRNVLKIHEKKVFSDAFLGMTAEIANLNVTYPGLILDTLIPKAIIKNIEDFGTKLNTVQTKKHAEVMLLQRSREDRFAFYKTKARELLAQNKSLCIVCPTVAIAQEVHLAISKGVEERCFIIHGSLSAKKTLAEFTKIREDGKSSILIGTSSCLALAPENVGEFIIESASSNTYSRTVAAPYIDLRLCVERMAYHAAVPCVYADTIIEAELWYRVNEEEMVEIKPSVQNIIDHKKLEVVSYQLGEKKQSESERIHELKHSKSGFHPLHIKSMDLIKKSIKEKKKIFIHVPKKGIAPNMICADCGNIAISPTSKLPYSLYAQKNKETKEKEFVFICSATGEKIPAFDLCQFCQGPHLKKMGVSTQGVADILIELFPKNEIIVLDGYAVKTKKVLKDIQEKFNAKGPVIVVGTSMAIEALSSWNIGIITTLAPLMSRMNYRNEEDALILISKIQGRTKEHLILQDRKELLESLPVLKSGIHSNFIKEELSNRKAYYYPPYDTLIKLKIRIQKAYIKKEYQYYSKRFESFDPSIVVKPHSLKELYLIVLIKLPRSKWNISYQEPQLYENLLALERNVEMSINPKSLS